jgi:hypothetical protein
MQTDTMEVFYKCTEIDSPEGVPYYHKYSVVRIDRDGTGGTYSITPVATLQASPASLMRPLW